MIELDVAPTLPGTKYLEALLDIEARSRRFAAGLPVQEESPTVWSGVLYQVGDTGLLTALADIAQVLDLPPEVTRVPTTKPWVRGVANNRGTLLPIFDLQAYLFDEPNVQTARNRILVVRQQEFSVGLLVTDVVGIRHYENSARRPAPQGLATSLAPFVTGCFGSESFPVLDLVALTRDPDFALVTA